MNQRFIDVKSGIGQQMKLSGSEQLQKRHAFIEVINISTRIVVYSSQTNRQCHGAHQRSKEQFVLLCLALLFAIDPVGGLLRQMRKEQAEY